MTLHEEIAMMMYPAITMSRGEMLADKIIAKVEAKTIERALAAVENEREKYDVSTPTDAYNRAIQAIRGVEVDDDIPKGTSWDERGCTPPENW